MQLRKLVSLCSVAALAACGSIPTQEFEFRAISVDGQRVPCLVVVEGNWPMGEEQVTYTDRKVVIPFARTDIRVLVKPAQVNTDGKVRKVPAELDPEPYKTDARDLRLGDPKVQLFILEKDNSYSG